MAESIVTIINPPQFMIKSYLKERLVALGYGDMVEIKEITKNQMPKEIELKFAIPELAQKFLSKIKQGGMMIANSTLVKEIKTRTDINTS